ncbi:uncharacterized protein LOC133928547 [Phragmites australis]|uniref:uncharacterized protein LOC133928547 n=1 Tax=Phragmites australis TaxID=29695 RepID=UPI002D7937E9|nr:uncharacterized protein LOC133928547 [Phragmites australis]
MLTVDRGGDDLTRSSNEEQRTSKGGGEMIGYLRTRLHKKRRTRKRGGEAIGYHLTRSDKKQKTCEGAGETIGSLTSDADYAGLLGDSSGSDQDVCDWLSEEVALKMARSVVSLILFDGSINILASSGIPIESKKPVTRLLTSGSLSRIFVEKRNSGCDMKIQVCDASNNVATGWLEQHVLDRGFTLVNVKQPLDVRAVHLDHEVEILPDSNLVGVELIDSAGPTAIRGILTKDSSASEDGIELSYSTCKISKAGDGGPLFDGDGNFIGMNLFFDTGRGAFMQRSVIIEKLEQFEKKIKMLARRRFRSRRIRAPGPLKQNEKHYTSYPEGNELTNQDLLEEDLNSLGYPKSVDCGMVLVNTFEDTFGDSYDSGEGVWGILSETVSKDLSQSVVSLASYKGETRSFVCSGIVTEWNGCTTILTSASLVRDRLDEDKIDKNLRIDVLLTNKQRTEGTLQHYNLHYNIAIVSFKGSCALSTANIYDRALNTTQVVAVGRCFESGTLMATRGKLTRWQRHWRSRFDCNVIQYSTCEITKAGIGGPVVDFEGKFVGMNFYDEKEGTPFLPQAMILLVLAHFEKKRIVAEADDDGYTNRWPVPKPFWRHPDHHRNEDK